MNLGGLALGCSIGAALWYGIIWSVVAVLQ